MLNDPLFKSEYTADPAPMVYNDTVFLYTTQLEMIPRKGFKMPRVGCCILLPIWLTGLIMRFLSKALKSW